MIHSGAILGASLGSGKTNTFGFDTSITKFKEFRNDHEKRDLIACGAACCCCCCCWDLRRNDDVITTIDQSQAAE